MSMVAPFAVSRLIPYFTDVDPSTNEAGAVRTEEVVEEDDLTAVLQQPAAAAAALAEADCSQSIPTAGLLHIISGATQGLKHALKG